MRSRTTNSSERSVEQEVTVLRRGFEPLIEAGLVSVDVVARATPAGIHDHLATGNYQLVHFIGHGGYDGERREGCLIFETEPGRPYPIGERETREIFCGRGLSLVFLNACETGRGGLAEFNKGIAQALVSHGLPSVVANQYSVLDSSATTFAQHFYRSLAQGMAIGQSAREARIAVNYSLAGEPIDWAVPVVYARDPAATLCDPPAARARVPSVAFEATRRRAGTARELRVGVWDMDEVFPALAQTLARMTEAQEVFGFELARLSVPLDVWEMHPSEGATYLWAERLASRLRRRPAELGVDILACITRHWLRNDDWLNLYGWWPDAKTPPILIFSVAGFDELEAEGRETDRVIANAAVAGLAGYLADVDTHARTPYDCPLSWNEERDFTRVAGRQHFDSRCRKLLQKKIGARLPALEALLGAFDGDDP